jgi:alginate O-acetyltransferase complex protein AlgI
MLFHEKIFVLFFFAVFFLYWFVCKKRSTQNLLIFVSSYIFYGWWDWRFLILIFTSSLIDFFVAKKIEGEKSEKVRKHLLWISLAINLGFLGVFKYLNFFIGSASELISLFGMNPNITTLNIILPVGISFYTFQTLSYTFDVYFKKRSAEDSLVDFFAYVSFFPQLVAGPIERSTHLLPQFKKERVFDLPLAYSGLRQMLWGYVKKIVIADQMAIYVNDIFQNYPQYSSFALAIGAVCFAFQIYGDFSGYSDIAIGLSKLFGFDLMTNFKFPYFSKNISEFWQRWHISLSGWFREYLYIPLGGGRGGMNLKIRNVFIVFLVSGFWHGANWTFVAWGLVHGLLYIPYVLLEGKKTNFNKNGFFDFPLILLNFILVCVAWVFFRSVDLISSFDYLSGLFSFRDGGIGLLSEMSTSYIFILGLFILGEWLIYKRYKIFDIYHLPRFVRWSGYYVLIFTFLFFLRGKTDFIYFQF